MYRYLVLLGLCAAMTVSVMAPVGARVARGDVATLKRITSKIDGRAGVITIEASDPVPYVATQPDPHSFVVEMRTKLARFPFLKTLDQFDFGFQPSVDERVVRDLATLRFLANAGADKAINCASTWF